MPQPWRPQLKDQPAKPGTSKQKRRRRFELKHEFQPLTLADVPKGSVLSDDTIAAIAAGEFVLARSRQPGGTRPSGKERARESRTARLLAITTKRGVQQ